MGEKEYAQAEKETEEEVVEPTSEQVDILDEAGNDEEETATELSEIEQLRQEKDELYQRLLRVQAEYDNFRKRTQKEKEASLKYRSLDVVSELLPALDNFERALQLEVKDETAAKFVEGMQMVYRQLQDALTKQGVEELKAEGEPFDPHLHQAVMQVEDDQYESNVVVEVLQKGYKLKDRVIRPAMVKVNQ
ncbi:nucleotide exchange factor GrpE [Aquibacillus sp. 3ASR75-11]|uniref:Protein GrpE n=1 Tax=Terrihalobacillus insolitus TaxID=2950438 RepID=A0A9X3WRY1_9BACI|nr:nucleotide exchange factor GrpE [Terrihalobacillus insolitus]MDC3413334.1 nucleotide exchange factor GrpE [Terrihalobacillus insolitus]MDC3424917.1 nucleotide exchange factor GrpE [Terrihalobacillus insolitus]